MSIESGYGAPIIVRSAGDPLQFERLSTSAADYDERFVQDLVFDHPECLPIRQIDRAYEHLLPVCKELNTPAGPLDALFVTPTGRLVLMEAKLWRNPEARRKVVAQILDYAKELSRWSYEDLQREVSRRLQRKGNALFELVAEQYPDVSEGEFVDEIQRTLQHGRFLLLIVGDGIREGAGAITEFLGNVGSLEFTFGLVEVAIFKNPDIGMLVQPRVLARTVELQRIVIEVPEGASISDDKAIEQEEDAELGETAKFYQDFWTEFLSELVLDDASQQLASVTRSQNIYFKIAESFNATWISAYFSKSRECVGVYLRLSKKAFGDAAFERLLSEREEIERELGFEAKWDERDKTYSVAVSRRFSDVHAPKHRAAIKAFFSDCLNQFVNVFKPRIERMIED